MIQAVTCLGWWVHVALLERLSDLQLKKKVTEEDSPGNVLFVGKNHCFTEEFQLTTPGDSYFYSLGLAGYMQGKKHERLMFDGNIFGKYTKLSRGSIGLQQFLRHVPILGVSTETPGSGRGTKGTKGGEVVFCWASCADLRPSNITEGKP